MIKYIDDDVDFNGKRVLLRVDFNVPLNDSKILNDYRIRSTIPTIKYIFDRNPKYIIILSHHGRPKNNEDKYSLYPICKHLENLIGINISFVKHYSQFNKDGGIYMFENIRYFKEELENNMRFNNKLTKLADIYVNDAFGCCHRNHSSIVGVNAPIKVGGFLLKKEILYLTNVFNQPQRKFLAIIGGSKISDKIKLIYNLIDKVDNILIGGGMAFTFVKVLYDAKIGNSLFDEEGSKYVKNIMKKADDKKVNIYFPVDFVVANKFSNNADINTVTINDGIPDTWMGLDVGPKTVELFSNVIDKSKTILWNGPLGVFEFPNFENGTRSLMEKIVATDKISIIGGGDSASCAFKFGLENQITHLSTGGGACLELLEGKQLVGINNLSSQ